MPQKHRPSKEELVRLRAVAIAVQRGLSARCRKKEIWEQAEREIDREARTLDGETGLADRRKARLG